MEYKHIIYEKKNWVATIILNQPEKLNAVSEELLADFNRALDEVERDDDVRVAIVTGAGRAFSAGANLGSRTLETRERTLVDWWNRMQAAEVRQFRQRDRTKPLIAAVNGYCLGLGLELALWCDIVIAADDARLGMPEIRHGSMVDSVIPWLVGMQRAKELILTGDTIDAQEADRIGLVTRVVPRERLLEEAYKLARRIAKVPPYAVWLNKLTIDSTFDVMGLRNAQAIGHKLSTICHALIPTAETADGINMNQVLRAQGVKAFLEVREAPFRRED